MSFLFLLKKKCAYQVFTCLLFSVFCSLDDVQVISYILLAKVLVFLIQCQINWSLFFCNLIDLELMLKFCDFG